MTTWNLPTHYIPPMEVESDACCDRPDVYRGVVCGNDECRKIYEIPVRLDGDGDWMPVRRFSCEWCHWEDYEVRVTYCVNCGDES